MVKCLLGYALSALDMRDLIRCFNLAQSIEAAAYRLKCAGGVLLFPTLKLGAGHVYILIKKSLHLAVAQNRLSGSEAAVEQYGSRAAVRFSRAPPQYTANPQILRSGHA